MCIERSFCARLGSKHNYGLPFWSPDLYYLSMAELKLQFLTGRRTVVSFSLPMTFIFKNFQEVLFILCVYVCIYVWACVCHSVRVEV